MNAPSIILIGAAFLAVSFVSLKRYTGLPPKGVLELVCIRTVNVISNVVATVLAGPMLALKAVVLGWLPFLAPWFLFGVTFGHREPRFLLDVFEGSVLMQRALFVTVTSAIGMCWIMLISTALHEDHGPPFSVLTFDPEKYLPTQS